MTTTSKTGSSTVRGAAEGPAAPAELALSVLRLSSDSLDAMAAPDVREHEPPGATHPAVLSGSAGTAALLDLPLRGHERFDVVVVEYRTEAGAMTRAWIRQDDAATASHYALFAETPASFPARSYAPAALAPFERDVSTRRR